MKNTWNSAWNTIISQKLSYAVVFFLTIIILAKEVGGKGDTIRETSG